MKFVVIAGAHFGVSLLIQAALLAIVPPLTDPLPSANAYSALFETPQYIFFKYCQALSHLPIYWVFRLNGTSPFILLLNSAAFASIVCACWKGWEIFRRKEAL
jgi:hypothetical protein